VGLGRQRKGKKRETKAYTSSSSGIPSLVKEESKRKKRKKREK